MGTAGTKIQAFASELVRAQKRTTTETLNRKNELLQKLLAVLESHESAENKINANESLTQQGKQAALAKLGTTETAPALKWLGRVVLDLEKTDQNYRQRFFTINSGIEDVAVRMPTYVYLWGKFDVLDQSARITRFSLAAEHDEIKVLGAMLEHPEGPQVTVDVKERALIERAKRLTPQQVEAFEQNGILLEYFVMVRAWIGRWLFGEVGAEIPVLRDALGDAVGDMLSQQTTGIPA